MEGPDIRLSLSTLLLWSSSDVNFHLSIIKFQATKTTSVLILVRSAWRVLLLCHGVSPLRLITDGQGTLIFRGMLQNLDDLQRPKP